MPDTAQYAPPVDSSMQGYIPQGPGDLADPDAQKKLAETVLTQLGLHPNQAGARNLLDLHLQSPTADPSVVAMAKPPEPALIPKPAAQPISTQLPGSSSSIPAPTAQPVGMTTPELKIPGPTPGSGIPSMGERLPQDQAELSRLINTGSGIHQIQNPFLRGLAKTGEIASDLFTPGLTRDIPGTSAHNIQLINNQLGLIKNDLADQEKQATTAETQARTQKMLNPDKTPTELSIWLEQNPGKPIDQYWSAKAESANPKLTPEETTMKFLTTPIEEGGRGMSADDAFKLIKGVETQNKPLSPGQLKTQMEGLLAKTFPQGKVNPAILSDTDKLLTQIENSQLTDQEKSSLESYFAMNNSPASQAKIAQIRAAASLIGREYPTLDNQGNLGYTNPATLNAHPGQYAPAAQGVPAQSKAAVFADLHFNVNNVRDAYENLQNGFDEATRAQLALVMRNPNPASALDAFMHSNAASSLTPDQVDLVTALASLNENAMALRSVAGLGSGSDEMRAAIVKTLPGAGTPSKDFARRQLDLLEGTIDRLETGVPKTRIKNPPAAPVSRTGQRGNSNLPQLQNMHINPTTGQKIGWDGRAWVDATSRKPVQ